MNDGIQKLYGITLDPTNSALNAQQTRKKTSVTDSFSRYFSETLGKTSETNGTGGATDSSAAGAADTEKNQIADAVNEAVKEAIINDALTSQSSLNGAGPAYSSFSGTGVEGMLLASAASGEITDAQIAMFMLCMLMNTAGEGSDTSMLSGAMFSLLSQMTGDKSSSADGQVSSGTDTSAGTVRQVKGWDSAVISALLPGLSATGGAIIPASAWIPTTPKTVSLEGNRNPESLRNVIDQFDVENSARYARKNSATYCNIFVWDVTSALGCEIPHFVIPTTGEPRAYPDVSGAMELDANGVYNWLCDYGAKYGWKEVSAAEAQDYANRGYPAVSAWNNPGGAGHVQIVCPSENGEYDSVRGPTVAQAGSTLANYTYQSNIYGSATQREVRYFVHA